MPLLPESITPEKLFKLRQALPNMPENKKRKAKLLIEQYEGY